MGKQSLFNLFLQFSFCLPDHSRLTDVTSDGELVLLVNETLCCEAVEVIPGTNLTVPTNASFQLLEFPFRR